MLKISEDVYLDIYGNSEVCVCVCVFVCCRGFI